ncbi:MAG: hypothetical protein AABW41_03145 [Nanoarchaeota archaeon]
MNKKGEESTSSSIMEAGTTVISIMVVLLIIIPVALIIYGLIYKDTGVKNSFQDLTYEVDKVIKTGKPSMAALYLSDKYDLVAFTSQNLKSGRYDKPTQCGLDYCLAICKKGLVFVKDNCEPPIAHKRYQEIELIFDENDPVLVSGTKGIVNVDISQQDNKITIKKAA